MHLDALREGNEKKSTVQEQKQITNKNAVSSFPDFLLEIFLENI